jgi:tetratricopeptide (TPR) repeat protein
LGNVLNAIGRPQEAEQSNRQGLALLEKLTADAPGVPQYRDNQAVGYENLGDIQFHAGRRQEAEQSYRQGLALLEKLAADAPGIPRYQYRLANWLADCADPALRDPGRAAVVAQRAVELAPADGKHWLTLGKAKYRTGAWQESAAALRKALERHPGDASDWFFLAMAHWQMGQPGEARQWSDQAVEWMDKNKPNDAELRRIRAEAAELLKEKSGDTDKK